MYGETVKKETAADAKRSDEKEKRQAATEQHAFVPVSFDFTQQKRIHIPDTDFDF